jgi:DNA invertase Pin-like site-specific DNA recombinase
MRKIGYARVSTADQNLDLQINALKAAGCEQIFRDQGVSGASTDRPGLHAALAELDAGDMLVVWRLDRLGRSLVHLVRLVNDLSQEGTEFQSLTENIDTSSAGGRLVFHMMAALAEFERSLISERTRAGMHAVQSKGHHVGRPRSLTADQRTAAVFAVVKGGENPSAVANRYRVHARTIRRAVNEFLGGSKKLAG